MTRAKPRNPNLPWMVEGPDWHAIQQRRSQLSMPCSECKHQAAYHTEAGCQYATSESTPTIPAHTCLCKKVPPWAVGRT